HFEQSALFLESFDFFFCPGQFARIERGWLSSERFLQLGFEKNFISLHLANLIFQGVDLILQLAGRSWSGSCRPGRQSKGRVKRDGWFGWRCCRWNRRGCGGRWSWRFRRSGLDFRVEIT